MSLRLFVVAILLSGCSGLMKDDASTAVLTVTCTVFCRVVYYENALSFERDNQKVVLPVIPAEQIKPPKTERKEK